MSTRIETVSAQMAAMGLHNLGDINYNLTAPELYEHALAYEEGILSEHGALCVNSVPYTGRRANDKFVVEEAATKGDVWWGKVNKPFSEDKFNALKTRVFAYLQGRDVYVQDLVAGADPTYALNVRFVQEEAYHSLFVQNMFIKAEESALEKFLPGFTVVTAPGFKSIPEIDGTLSEVFIILSFEQKLVLIGGTSYAGENKKSIFTVLNYLMPKLGVMSMHCSANIGPTGDTALFFGLSGTGKTTLSTDPERALIGDDEHGWSNDGVFNYEGGCYAKVINLNAEAEPIIFGLTRTFGTILENVDIDEDTRVIDLDSQVHTENTRIVYTREHSEHRTRQSWWTSEEHRVPHSGCVRCNAPYLTSHTRTSDVPLPEWLHSEGCWNRSRREGTISDILNMLRRAVHGASPKRVCKPSSRQDQRTRIKGVVGEHRLERRSVRYWTSHEDQAHTCNAACCTQRTARQRCVCEGCLLQSRDPNIMSGRTRRSAQPTQYVGGHCSVRQASSAPRRALRRELQAVRRQRR